MIKYLVSAWRKLFPEPPPRGRRCATYVGLKLMGQNEVEKITNEQEETQRISRQRIAKQQLARPKLDNE